MLDIRKDNRMDMGWRGINGVWIESEVELGFVPGGDFSGTEWSRCGPTWTGLMWCTRLGAPRPPYIFSRFGLDMMDAGLPGV